MKSIANRIIKDREAIKNHHNMKDILLKRINRNEELLLKYALREDNTSESQYMISCLFKDGKERHVTISDGYPCWIETALGGKRFSSIEQAKEWFDEFKKYLIEKPYGNPDDITDTINIREILYKVADTIDISNREGIE